MTNEEAATLAPEASDFAPLFAEQERRAKSLLEGHRERLVRLDAALAEQIELLDEAADGERRTFDDRDRALAARERELAERSAEAERAASQLAASRAEHERTAAELRRSHEEWLADLRTRQADLDALRRATDERASALDERQTGLDRRQHDLERRETAHDGESQRLSTRESQLVDQLGKLRDAQAAVEAIAQRQSHEAAELRTLREAVLRDRAEIERETEKLIAKEEQAKSLRRRIARELRAQRSEQAAEMSRREAEVLQLSAGEDTRLKSQLADAHSENQRLRDRQFALEQQLSKFEESLAASQAAREEHDLRKAELQKSRAAAEHAERRADELQGEIAKERDRLARERDELLRELELARAGAASAQGAGGEALSLADKEIERLRSQLEDGRLERKQQRATIESLEERLAAASDHASEGDGQWKARLDMALADVRDLKARNAELEEKLARAPAAAVASAAPGQDWESRKKRLLEQLESDFDESDPAQKRDKLSVSDAIRATDRAVAERDQTVAERDREIDELKRLLDQQSSSIGDVAVGAAAFAQAFDQDEIIREERENLKRAQDECREKMRKAEVDISLERAKLARERAELEEQLRSAQSQRPREEAQPTGIDGDKSKKSGRKWLARLGLKEGEE